MQRSVAIAASRPARRFASASMLKRSVNLRPRRPTSYTQLDSKANSSLALDSTLSYLTVKHTAKTTERLSWSQIRSVMLGAAVPMVGFGFMDNFVMIQAGSYIDSTIGVRFGLATLTAAAMGQVFSDISGVLFGGSLERMLSPWVKPANLTAAQQKLAMVPRLRLAGGVIGVAVGCCLGALSLFFVLDSDSAERGEQVKQLHGVLQDMLETEQMKGSKCVMHMNNVGQTVGSSTVSIQELSEESLESNLSHCAKEQEVVSDGHKAYFPVLTKDGKTLAVMELTRESGFSTETMEEAESMARHMGFFINRV